MKWLAKHPSQLESISWGVICNTKIPSTSSNDLSEVVFCTCCATYYHMACVNVQQSPPDGFLCEDCQETLDGSKAEITDSLNNGSIPESQPSIHDDDTIYHSPMCIPMLLREVFCFFVLNLSTRADQHVCGPLNAIRFRPLHALLWRSHKSNPKNGTDDHPKDESNCRMLLGIVKWKTTNFGISQLRFVQFWFCKGLSSTNTTELQPGVMEEGELHLETCNPSSKVVPNLHFDFPISVEPQFLKISHDSDPVSSTILVPSISAPWDSCLSWIHIFRMKTTWLYFLDPRDTTRGCRLELTLI